MAVEKQLNGNGPPPRMGLQKGFYRPGLMACYSVDTVNSGLIPDAQYFRHFPMLSITKLSLNEI
jgi:hypothetical protein